MLKRFFLLFLLMPFLGGCYLPARFDAEIEISRTGFYKLEFIGYMAEVGLYQGLKDGKIDAIQEKEKVEILARDFTRDKAVKEFSYFGKGHFKVHYSTNGDLVRTSTVTFVRRNENILSISSNRDTGIITVRGKYLKKNDKDRLVDAGLWMEGEVRVKTDGEVIGHNATSVAPGQGRNEQVFTWKISSPYDPAPKLELMLR